MDEHDDHRANMAFWIPIAAVIAWALVVIPFGIAVVVQWPW